MSKDPDRQTTEQQDARTPDIDLVDASDWRRREFPLDDGRRENSVRVVIKQSVLNDIHQHGQSTTDVEICGVLVGAGYRDDRGPFVYIEANIRGQHSDSKAAQVTFTGETWNHIHNELDRLHPELQILGWYHTHPGFGVFLSGMDLFIHENYFSGEHQLALVYDPIGGDEGLFVWRDGRAVRDGFLIERDAEEDPPPANAGPPSEPMTAGAMEVDSPRNDAVDADLPQRVTRIERLQVFSMLGVLAAIALAIAAPLFVWMFLIEPRLPAASATNSPFDKDPRPVRPVRVIPLEPSTPPPSHENSADGDEIENEKADAPTPSDADSDTSGGEEK